jgi:organic radical activating enzyme
VKNKLVLPFLETMITQVCNISCEGCTNYSDLPHKGYISWEDGKNTLEQWLNVIDIPDFGIMGGEPLINPQVYDWIYGIRELMPNAQIRFTTNGLLLHKKKFKDIMSVMHDIGNAVFKISVHINNDAIQGFIDNTLSEYNWTEVTEFEIKRFKSTNDVRLQLNYPSTFVKPFKNDYSNMQPYNSDPNDAFKQCIQQTCPLLYNGKIHKCSTSALLTDTLQRFGMPNLDLWEEYISDGISCNDNIKIINDFIMNFGRSNKICGQCPSIHDSSSKIAHNESTISIK